MQKQVALITGSTRGIGLNAAIALAKQGFSIAINGPEDNDELSNAVKTVQEVGVSVIPVVLDVCDIAKHESTLKFIESELGSLTTLVNNAGVGVLNRGELLEVSEKSFDRCFDVNTKALFFLTQAFSKQVLSSPRNPELNYSIVNITSSNAVAVAEARGEYCGSKAAAAMISKVFATRLAREGISVYDIQPGLINTDMTKPVIESYQQRATDGLCLIPRVGQPDEVGEVVATLASGKLPYTTGQVISVDGGMLVPRF